MALDRRGRAAGAQPARRRVATLVLLAGATGGAALVLGAPGPAPALGVWRVAADCAPLPPQLCPPTPTPTPPPPPPPTATPKPPPPTATPKPKPPTPPPSNAPAPSFPPPPSPVSFPTPPPPLPSPTPGPPPPPPTLEVQSIVLTPATTDPVVAGTSLSVQVTCEAKRGADLYAVPKAAVTLAVASATGDGAVVVPSSTDSGDTGAVVVTVRTGDQPGSTVLTATAGSATAQLTVSTVQASPSTPTPTVGAGHVAPAAASPPSTRRGGPLLIAALAAISAGLLASIGLAYVRLPRMRGRRRGVWGRRTEP